MVDNLPQHFIKEDFCGLSKKVKSKHSYIFLYSCKTIKNYICIHFMHRDYTVRRNGLQRARKVITEWNKFVITKCDKKRYKVRQKKLQSETGCLITQGGKVRSQSRNNIGLQSVTKKIKRWEKLDYVKRWTTWIYHKILLNLFMKE